MGKKKVNNLLVNGVFFQEREHKNTNDCWADALSLATDKTYEEVFELFKGLQSEGGGLRTGFCDGYLELNGFERWEIEYDDKISVQYALDTLNYYDSTVVIAVNGHIVCAKGGCVHDNHNEETAKDLLKRHVVSLYMKVRKED